MKKINLTVGAVSAAVAVTLLLGAPPALAASVVHEEYTPATGSYISFCDGNYHGLRYCNFTKNFSVSQDQVITDLVWYDLGCDSRDRTGLTLFYTLVNADTFAVVAETTERKSVACTLDFPTEHNNPTVLPINPTLLAAGQEYFVMLHSSNNERARAYWGVDAPTSQTSFQVLNPLNLAGIGQFAPDGSTPISEGGVVTQKEVVFKGQPASDRGGQVRVEVELRRWGEEFTGEPTARGELVDSGQTASVILTDVADGAYRWRMRAADETGSISPWQEFGTTGNSDLEVFAEPLSSTLPIPNPSCQAPVTFVPHAPMVVKAANFWTSCNGSELCNSPAYSQILDASGSVVLAESDRLPFGFEYTQGAHDVNYTTNFSGDNQITLQPGVIYAFRNVDSSGNHCTDGPYHPDSAYLTVAPPPVPRQPVLIVPGILGSSLNRAADGSEIWPDVNSMVFSASDNYLDDLKLGPDGTETAGKEMRSGAVIQRASFALLGQELVTQNFYGGLVQEFVDRGYVPGTNLFEVAYDWRRDVKSEVARLGSAVLAARATSPDGKVSIVAHSMGGLLVKQYLVDPDQAAFVDKVVLAGVPQTGAPAMFKALNYGDNLGFKLPVVNLDLLNPAQVKSMAQNMPGAYELLPSRRYVSDSGGYVQDFRNGSAKTLSYDETAALMIADPADSRNPALLAVADGFHDALDGQAVSGPRVYNLAACGNPATLGEIRLYDDGEIDIGSAEGDGTVPLLSAMHLAQGYENYFVSSRRTGIDHSGLVRDGRTTALIAALTSGEEVDLPQGMAMSSGVCSPQSGERTLRFSTHSPVVLHVYDSAGRHTGPLPEGGVELGIPGSSYDVLGGNSFAFVPEGDTYRVLSEGLAQGEFTLKALLLDGLDITASTTYIDVPLAGPSTVAEAVFTADDLGPELSLDLDGDGAVDSEIGPAVPSSAPAGPTGTIILAPPAARSGSSGGGSGSGVGSAGKAATQVLGVATSTPALPVCLEVPAGVLGRGRSNDRNQVVLLQAFLNREFGLQIPLTGFFGPITELAVKIFQLTHYTDILVPAGLTAPTGFAGKYTLLKISTLACR